MSGGSADVSMRSSSARRSVVSMRSAAGPLGAEEGAKAAWRGVEAQQGKRRRGEMVGAIPPLGQRARELPGEHGIAPRRRRAADAVGEQGLAARVVGRARERPAGDLDRLGEVSLV